MPHTIARHFELDDGWVQFAELERCERGEDMRLHALVYGHPREWRTTTVLSIRGLADV